MLLYLIALVLVWRKVAEVRSPENFKKSGSAMLIWWKMGEGELEASKSGWREGGGVSREEMKQDNI